MNNNDKCNSEDREKMKQKLREWKERFINLEKRVEKLEQNFDKHSKDCCGSHSCGCK